MVRPLVNLTVFAVAGLALVAATAADAKPRRNNEITLQPRSYFDAGVVVRPGSTGSTNYIVAGQNLQTPAWGPSSLYGATTLPGRFDVPGCCGVTVNTPNFYMR